MKINKKKSNKIWVKMSEKLNRSLKKLDYYNEKIKEQDQYTNKPC